MGDLSFFSPRFHLKNFSSQHRFSYWQFSSSIFSLYLTLYFFSGWFFYCDLNFWSNSCFEHKLMRGKDFVGPLAMSARRYCSGAKHWKYCRSAAGLWWYCYLPAPHCYKPTYPTKRIGEYEDTSSPDLEMSSKVGLAKGAEKKQMGSTLVLSDEPR